MYKVTPLQWTWISEFSLKINFEATKCSISVLILPWKSVSHQWKSFGFSQVICYTEVFKSTGFGNNGFSGVTDILAIPKVKFSIKKAQSNGFSGVTDKMAIPDWSGTSENLCTYRIHIFLNCSVIAAICSILECASKMIFYQKLGLSNLTGLFYMDSSFGIYFLRLSPRTELESKKVLRVHTFTCLHTYCRTL